MSVSRFRFYALSGCTAAALLVGCGSRVVPAANGSGVAPASVRRSVDVAGVYNGTVTETSQGRSIHAKLKITFKQSGDKLTGIFDIILKTLQDQFPIPKGVVVESNGKTILHFIIEGSPGRNAKAVATLVGATLHGKAKVPPHGGPAVYFKYTAKKA